MPVTMPPVDTATAEINSLIFEAKIAPHHAPRLPQALVFALVSATSFLLVEFALYFRSQLLSEIYLGVTGCSILVAMLVFRRNFRRLEHIVVSGGAVVVAYYFQDALIEQRRMMIYGLGIEREDDPDFGCLRVSLRQRDRRIEIGRDLSPFERAHLSDRLVSALRDAGIPPKMRHINHAPFFPTDPNLAKSV